jgi:hypothetical protein
MALTPEDKSICRFIGFVKRLPAALVLKGQSKLSISHITEIAKLLAHVVVCRGAPKSIFRTQNPHNHVDNAYSARESARR